ncbi:MAG: hypothetical protein KDA44_02290 [Planctomycetales bacterium]|nr:hypothetical protein [Planctomycetales bacterium]
MTSASPAKRPLLGASLKLLAAAGAACAVASLAYNHMEGWYRQARADRLALAALHAPDGRAAGAVARLPELGTVGVERLAWLAAEPRADLATPARRELDERLEIWLVNWRETSDAGALLQPLTQAVRVLRARVGQFAANDVRWCETFAMLSMELSEALPPDEAAGLIADCEAILATLPRRRAQPHAADPAQTTAFRELQAPAMDMHLLATPAERPPRPGNAVVGSAAPRQPASLWSTAPPTTDRSASPIAMQPLVEPPLAEPPLVQSRVAEPPLVDAAAKSNSEAVAQALPRSEAPAATGPGGGIGAAVRLAPLPTPLEVRDQARMLRDAPAEALLRQLPTADHFQAAAIRRELAERGTPVNETSAAGQSAGSPPPAQLTLAERLTRVPSGESRRILRQLAESGDAETRIEALSLLAAMHDPQLPEIARRRAVHDNDARVAARATEILNTQRR